MFRRVIDQLYPQRECLLTIGGLDNSGKTVLLYLMKNNDLIQTIPTIGFNVEDVKTSSIPGVPTHSIKRLNVWDVGSGCGRMQPFHRLYFARSDAMIWTIDSTDRERLAESVDVLRSARWGEFDKGIENVSILVLATKQDLPNAMSIDQIRKAVAPALKGLAAFTFGVSLTKGMVDGGVSEAIDWLLMATESSQERMKQLRNASSPGEPKQPSTSSEDPLQGKLETWLSRATEDSSPEEFLSQFDACSLPSWDHYTHIRVAYVILITHGRQKGKNMIFNGIENYIVHNSQANERTKFHVTMTYFWIQIVHFGIQATSSGGNGGLDDFVRFLLLNPYVADGRLWAQYYSQDVMMSPGARAEMVFPDKKPFPSMLERDKVGA